MNTPEIDTTREILHMTMGKIGSLIKAGKRDYKRNMHYAPPTNAAERFYYNIGYYAMRKGVSK